MSRTAPEIPPRPEAPPDVTAWLSGLGRPVREVQPLPGDVSTRRYARVRFADDEDDADDAGNGTAILATYPPEVLAVCPRFVRTTALLAGAGVPVPRVLASDCAAGFMLVEDLGPQTLGDWKGRPWSELTPYFQTAVRLGGRIARLPAAEIAGLNPPLGTELLRRELAQTWDLFLAPRGLTGDAALTAAFRAALDDLCARLGAGPLVPCHRDFMSRNLMPILQQDPGEGGLVVLDHQDLRLGPAAYDLASLLNDTLFPPPAIEEELLAAALPGLPPAAGETSRTSYHRAAAQRTLKAVGTYTSFALRGANRHLPLIGPTLARCLLHLARIPEGEALAGDLGRLWQPVLAETAETSPRPATS
jgi:aminoglycoside/choline kinase family phosphotransferase